MPEKVCGMTDLSRPRLASPVVRYPELAEFVCACRRVEAVSGQAREDR